LLEQQLGVTLFERVGKKAVLTSAGVAVAAELSAVIDGLATLADAAGRGAKGTLRLGTLPTVSAYMLAGALAGFVRTHPGAQLVIEHGLTEPQLMRLRRGELDVVISVGPRPEGRVHVADVARADAALAMPRELAPGRRRLSVNQMKRYPYIRFGAAGDNFFDAVWRFVSPHVAAAVRLHVGHIQTIKALIQEGAGVSVLPRYTVREAALTTRSVDGLDVSYPVWFAARETNRQAPLVAALWECCRSALHASPAQGFPDQIS
jgi:DNA-binding transcriptional LysR family regulator